MRGIESENVEWIKEKTVDMGWSAEVRMRTRKLVGEKKLSIYFMLEFSHILRTDTNNR